MSNDKWIQKAVKKPGALTDYVRQHYGDAGFTNGKIKRSILLTLAKKEGKVGKRAKLALTFRKF